MPGPVLEVVDAADETDRLLPTVDRGAQPGEERPVRLGEGGTVDDGGGGVDLRRRAPAEAAAGVDAAAAGERGAAAAGAEGDGEGGETEGNLGSVHGRLLCLSDP